MELKELERSLEAVLFAAGEPVPVERLCLGLDSDRPTIDAVAQKLMDQYKYERRGIRLVRLLLERELIEESGRLPVPGRPILYKTTKNFLRCFGLTSLEELPALPELPKEGEQMTLKLEQAAAALQEEET